MHKSRPCLITIVMSAAAWLAPVASAAGLGGGSSGAVLGQPLDFAVQLRLDAGESLGPECVSAEVMQGERRLPPGQVKTAVELQGAGMARIRITTLQAVDEPVIGINLSAGCGARVMRRYVVLADPPVNVAPTPPAAPESAALPLAEAQLPPASPSASIVMSPQPSASVDTAVAAPRLAQAQRPVGQLTPPSSPRAERRVPHRAEKTQASPRAQATSKSTKRASAAPATPATPAAASAPARLQLDLVAPAPGAAAAGEAAIEAVAQAASATRLAAAAASSNADRLAAMERTVEQLRSDSKASRELAAQWREKLTEADQSGRWMLPLLVVTLMLAALAAWLAWRLAAAQRERQQDWQHAVVPAPPETLNAATPSRQPTAPAPFLTAQGRADQPANSAGRARSAPAWPPPAPSETLSGNTVAPTTQFSPRTVQTVPARHGAALPADDEPATHQTDVLAANVRIDEGAARDVSIEELIDLEQQAEFFVVLGQDDSAVELLNEHLRTTGGGSPLPYLKLLEIHHRRGSRRAYDSLRERFNPRFNAYAPEWGSDLLAGRALADYSGVIPRLQQVWARPLDAMAELEALLFRKSRGDLFDLPAYREVLFLYALARELMDREALDSGNVDLLLPMADGGEFSSTSPAPLLLAERGGEPEGGDDRPTMPLDFDLSAAERPASIFQALDDPATRPPERP